MAQRTSLRGRHGNVVARVGNAAPARPKFECSWAMPGARANYRAEYRSATFAQFTTFHQASM
jgi:hypothetical protein